MKRLYFIDDKYIGQSSIPSNRTWMFSIVWVCEGCGETFARLPVEDKPTGPGCWRVFIGYCGKCPQAKGYVPGSIWRSHEPEYIKLFPLAVIEREFNLLINLQLKGEL